MPVTITLKTIPIGSQLTSTIGADDLDSKNDFRVRILLDGNGTGLTEDGITLSTGASLVEITGSNSAWEATVRPPVTAVTLTFTVNSDAFTEGNAETDLDIRVSTAFPDDDAEVPTLLFSATGLTGITVTPTRILAGSTSSLRFFLHDGTEQTSESLTLSNLRSIDYFNGTILTTFMGNNPATRRALLNPSVTLETYNELIVSTFMHTPMGFLGGFKLLKYSQASDETPTTLTGDTVTAGAANDGNLIYSLFERRLVEIVDATEMRHVRYLNIANASGTLKLDAAIYRDTFYMLSGSGVYTIDIRPYRPIEKNTKTTIYPVFANEGDTIPLKQFCPDAHTITFGIDFDKPSYLSINADNEIEIASNAVTEATPVLVKLTGINYIDSIDFEFYLVIVQAANPVVRDVDELTMRANSTYDLFGIVSNAASITLRSGQTQPTGSSISNGVFTIGSAGGTAYFTATNDNGSTHFQIEIDVVGVDTFSDTFRHRVEIEGIDISADLVSPTIEVSESLDAIRLNVYQVNEATVTLGNGDGRYNPEVSGNFWDTHSLNPYGQRNRIKIYLESLISGTYASSLLFSGQIGRTIDLVAGEDTEARLRLICVDISQQLQNTLVSDFGTLEKWDALRQQSDEATYEGVYVPESSLLPIQLQTGTAWRDRTALTLSGLPIRSEGLPQANTAYLTPQDLRTAGGFLDERPILRFKTQHRSENFLFIVEQLAKNRKVYNTHIDVPALTVDDPFILNRGSVPFSVENTRITRLPTDWVHDSTNDWLLIPLSNPEGHIADMLVQYNIASDSYRALHTFDKDISVHRITLRTSTDYYILSAKAVTQDRSAPALPRPIDATGYAYDSLAEESEIKILRYNASTDTLTDHVDETDDRPPQLGIHYHVGFENALYIDEFEGIVADYRGSFKWYSGNLYYRYASPSEFGVARVNTDGATTEMIDQTTLNYHNHLNFAFDVNSSGDIYFVYATGDESVSSLVIKRRTSGGTETTRLSETRPIGNVAGFSEGFGAFLGAHECLFHDDHLYILAPIQAVDLGEEAQSFTADPDITIEQLTAEKSGERNVTTATNLNPTSTRLAPGDDIPIRIDFDGSVSGATQSDLTVIGGTIQSFSISSDMIDVTIRPDNLTAHKNIVIDLAEDAVDQDNEAWRITINFGTRRSRTKGAGMALYKCNVTAASPTLTVIETWDFVQLAGCNLVIHDGAVHYMEHPPASQLYTPYNPDLESYSDPDADDGGVGYNIVSDPLGALKKVNNSDEPESLGSLWFEERAYNVAATPAISVDGALHVMMGYGELDAVLRSNAPASKADNVQHLVYGEDLHYVVPAFEATGSVYDALAGIAAKVNATVSIEKNIISLRDRRPYQAQADGATGTGAGNLGFDGENKAFPNSGYARIGDEFIGYTGIGSGAFTGVTRGSIGTAIANHANNADILYLDALIHPNRLKGSVSIAATRIYNVIRNSDGTVEVPDDKDNDDSIAAYGERPLTLDLGLTQHESVWQENVFNTYLRYLKYPRLMIDISVQPGKDTWGLQLGHVVGFRYSDLVYSGRIVAITYGAEAISLEVRTI